MLLHDRFIGNNLTNQTTNWSGLDSEELFRSNKKSQLPTWYYNNAKINYCFNKNGHRCKNIEDVNLDNYVLFAGCSHTEGVGLELTNTFPYVVSEQLGVDYYNLGIGGSGIDVLKFNVVTWLTTVPKLPIAVIIQWPDYTRVATTNLPLNQTSGWHFLPRGVWNKDSSTEHFIASGVDIGFFLSQKILAIKLLENVCKVPLHTFNVGSQTPHEKFNGMLHRLDSARDLAHFGIKSHQKFAELMCDAIQRNRFINQQV